MPLLRKELGSLASHLQARRGGILSAWGSAVAADADLAAARALSKLDFEDHVPALLATFEAELRGFQLPEKNHNLRDLHRVASEHGVRRWQQGYDLGELVRELGRLNECLVHEIDCFTLTNVDITHNSISIARRLWARFATVGIEESVQEYARLQREEAAGQSHDLEAAMAALRALEGERADLWHQAAHDLRGNLGVVANASVGLTNPALSPPLRDRFVRILIRNITSLHQLLDDVTQLARLQAGQETRRLEPLDVTPLVHELCDGIRAVAEEKGLYLRCEGPAGLGVQGDPVKLRRIAQNLILNAVKFTATGGITVSWSDGSADDSLHWMLVIEDTGPGFPSESGRPIATALESARLAGSPATARDGRFDGEDGPYRGGLPRISDLGAGEGLGLSIVKRLCEALDATVERHSKPGQGTTFRILFPKTYAGPNATIESGATGYASHPAGASPLDQPR